MAFVTGSLLIDAPASALNNAGTIIGERDENTSGVKVIRTREGTFPYASAQSYRYWLRTTAQNRVEGWKAAPIYREEKIAYTDSNPILWWDDDLFGYMRVPSKKTSAKEQRQADLTRAGETETNDAISRVSPFRMSTLVSIAPVKEVTSDFGVMARHEGYPVPHEHQLYRSTLKGLFSLDLHTCGTFLYKNKAGYRNLDQTRVTLAQQQGLEHLENEKAYRLTQTERLQRIQGLFKSMSLIEGGAKQGLHYTDVSPVLSLFTVTRGGNNLFGHIIGANAKGLPIMKWRALSETLAAFEDEILSPLYIGWVPGYLDEERSQLEAFQVEYTRRPVVIGHPHLVYQQFVNDLALPENVSWLA